MASGNHRTFYGSVVGTGADLDVRTVGFRPKEVQYYNVDGLATGLWTETLADGLALKAITAGTISMTSAGDGVTPLSDGFTLGADSDLNVSTEVIHFVARG